MKNGENVWCDRDCKTGKHWKRLDRHDAQREAKHSVSHIYQAAMWPTQFTGKQYTLAVHIFRREFHTAIRKNDNRMGISFFLFFFALFKNPSVSLTVICLHAFRVHGSFDDHCQLHRFSTRRTFTKQRQNISCHITGKLDLISNDTKKFNQNRW